MISRIRSARGLSAAVVMTLIGGAFVAAPAGAQSVAEPVVAYWTPDEAIVADGLGQEIRRFPNFAKMSLGRNVLAGEVQGSSFDRARLVIRNATTGERLYGIRNARLPVVTGAGRKIAFFPTFYRDDMALSVWMRLASGRVKKLAQFKTRGKPGIPHRMRGGASPLDMAFDERGRTMALVGGLEPLRSFDVWLVDVRTKEAKRMTRGANSHNPSLSPDGSQLAVRVESPEPCNDHFYGEILIGKIRAISVATGERKDLTEWNCGVFYDTPRWIDNETLVAVRIEKDATQEYGYNLDIVKFDAITGEMTELVTEGNPCCISVSATLGKIAYGFSDRDGFAVYDLATGTAVDFPGQVYVPHLSGENRL